MLRKELAMAKYYIERKNYYYEDALNTISPYSYYMDNNGKPLAFDNRQAAEMKLQEVEDNIYSNVYYFDQNEYARPSYRVVRKTLKIS
jgi:hypothetical protein